MVLGLGHSEVVEHADDLSGSGVVRTKTVAATDDERTILHVVVSILHVEVQRLAVGTGLLCAVEDGDLLHALGNAGEQVLHAERTIEVNRDHTNLLALSVQVVDSLAGCIGGRTHEDDHAVSILSSVVREEVILAAGDLGDLAEVLLNHFGHLVVVRITCLAVCEEGLGVLGCTTCDGTLRSECTVTETLDVVPVNQWKDILIIETLNLVILVRGTETVEEGLYNINNVEKCVFIL